LALLPRVVRGARRPAEDSEGLQAGMEGVDTERVQRITYEMSKGSAHFVNEQRKQAAVTERIDKMQARAAQLTPALVGTQPALCTPPSRPFARHPAGPCLSISLRLALERPPSSVSYNNGAQLRPLRLCSHWSGAALAAGGGTTAHSAIAYDSTGDDARPVAHVAVRLPLGLAPCLPPRLSLTASLTISPTGPRTVSPSPPLPHRLAHHLSHCASQVRGHGRLLRAGGGARRPFAGQPAHGRGWAGHAQYGTKGDDSWDVAIDRYSRAGEKLPRCRLHHTRLEPYRYL
jgi:hypothetical protein